MRRKLLSKSFEDPEGLINLTPLIDVVFVVLIVFILVAPLVELEQIALAPANAKKEKKEFLTADQQRPIVIHVYPDNQIRLNKKKVDLIELEIALKKLRIQYPNASPNLFQDKKAQFGTYQMVKNAVETAGFDKLDVILESN